MNVIARFPAASRSSVGPAVGPRLDLSSSRRRNFRGASAPGLAPLQSSRPIRHGFTAAAAGFILAFTCLAAQAKLNVVATTPDLAAIAREIGGDHVEITTLARPTEDVHFVDSKPSFIVKLNKADALIEGGAELENGWLPSLVAGARNARILPDAPGRIVCSRGIEMLEVPAVLDRSKGDIHAAGNPHYAIDPENAKVIARHICESFCQLDESACPAYRANLARFIERLDASLTGWLKKLEPFKGQRVAAYHNSWPYFSRRFGVEVDVFLEPKPGIPPSPAHLAEVVARMREQGVRVIFLEPHVGRKTAETVARNTGAKVVPVSQFPGGVKGTEAGYIATLDHIVNALAEALAAH